ncbi:hypothetical protein LB572_23000 [Mesorhizobium sp. BH1-1-5]|uniref:hypothetical protein n=1 Tax=Mesorhizobium sp. BH1-1-5 TaxID=2876661 RepID=UPI001CCFFDE4|nr:hypothetical protein [Mesorhizobium sp. BH1-1-5]MBZ9989972.1 hypothetical protein [Mesorhizobium sp. BH1-1-5]
MGGSATWLLLGGGVCGFVSAILLAAPAFRSIDSRGTLIKLGGLKLTMKNQELLAAQENELLEKALQELKQERRYLRRGLALLALSFALTTVGTWIDSTNPAEHAKTEAGSPS